MFLIYDTETTGLPKNDQAPLTDFDNWPRLIQLAWQMHDENGEVIEVNNYLIKPEGFIIPRSAEKIHGISTERAEKEGNDLREVLEIFSKSLVNAKVVIGHNIEFDNTVMQGASIFHLARGLHRRNFFTTRDILGAAWKQAYFRVIGVEDPEHVAEALSYRSPAEVGPA